MEEKQQHGGRREGSGRTKKSNTIVLSYRVSAELSSNIDKEIRELLSKHLTQINTKPIDKECGCKVIGYTAKGKEIVGRCKQHR